MSPDRRIRVAALIVPLFAVALGASASSQSATTSGQGEELFKERCGGCHLESGFGTRLLARRVPEGQAMLEMRDNLQPQFVKAVVRLGIGSMPQIREAELSDSELDLIAAYLEPNDD